MSDSRPFRRWLMVCACLAFTGGGVAWADDDTPVLADHYIEDPMAPHVTKGSAARIGTSVGFIYGERLDVLALGLTGAYGYRFGRIAVEAEYTYLDFQKQGPSSMSLGDGQRLGVIGRLDVLRLGSHIVGGNSMLAVYVEGGAAVVWNDWYEPQAGESERVVPIDTKRVEAQTGFGIQIDHRLQEPIGFPHRIGWFLGWRMGLAPHDAEPANVCRGTTCKAAPMMPHERYTDRSMLFQSSLQFTW